MTMHVVQIIDTLTRGGAQQLLVTFGAEAKRRKIATTVMCLSDDDEGSVLVERLRQNGVEVVRFPAGRLADPWRLYKMIRFLRRGKFTVAQTHLTYANILGTLAARLAHIPVVGTLHLAGANPDLLPRKQQIENAMLRRWSNEIIAVGYAAAEIHETLIPGREITVIPNAVEPLPPISSEERQNLRTELLGEPTRPVLLSIGRLSSIKALPDMIDAFAIVALRHPEAMLIMAGSGDEHDKIVARIAHHGLEQRVRMLGARDDVARLMHSADVFVSSSFREGLPVAVLEAMSAGLPVVGTAVGDMPQVVVEGTGFLVPPHEPEQLGEALNALLDDPALMKSLGAGAAARAATDYSPSTWVDRLVSVYNQAREPGSAGADSAARR
jgi:glycosyltransferase involved in cell wall biosynthesis